MSALDCRCVCVWEEVVRGVMEALRDAELTYMVICINHLVNQWGPPRAVAAEE